jgi:hypothetical protein
MDVYGQLQNRTALIPGKEAALPIGEEVRWASEPVWTMWRKEKSLALVGNQTPAVQPVARRYTD